MLAVALVLPALLSAAVTGAALLRRGREEPFTAATVLQILVQAAILAGLLSTLVGLAVGLKVALSYLDSSITYGAYTLPSAQVGLSLPSPDEERFKDLVLAWWLSGVGTATVVVNGVLGGAVARRPGGAQAWVAETCMVVLTALTGLVGLLAAAGSGYQALQFERLGAGTGGRPFADMLGVAVVFLAAWVGAIAAMKLGIRRPAAAGEG